MMLESIPLPFVILLSLLCVIGLLVGSGWVYGTVTAWMARSEAE